MSSGFSGTGAPDFYTTSGGFIRRSMLPTNNPQLPYRSPLAGILSDNPASQMIHRLPDFSAKRSFSEFQHYQLQQQQWLGLHLRNVKQRTYQQTSPLSPSVDFSASLSPELSSSVSSSGLMNPRYGLPILHQLRSQVNGTINPSTNLVQNGVVVGDELLGQETKTKMMNRLQELEKQLLDDDDDDNESGDAVSVITNSEWSETIQNLISSNQNVKTISSSPTSSPSSSCSSSSASPPITSPKQSIIEAASAISEGKTDTAVEILTRLNTVSNIRGTSEQRLTAYMASALRSRLNPTEYKPPVAELYRKEHMFSTQMMYDLSPCFKLGFMAANHAILETAASEENLNKIHVLDFDIGQGGQYVHLLHALGAAKSEKPFMLKVTTFMEFSSGVDDMLMVVGDRLKAQASKLGVGFCFNVLNLKISDLCVESLGVENNEMLAVNFAFKLYKLPDESVTIENLRDDLLRRVKRLSPKVMTVVEQEMNANTAAFVARVNEACGYYGALFDSFDATVSRDNSERVRIEEGLGRKIANSVACEGKDRVERCEVLGKWRARMGMAGFEHKPISQPVADSLRSKLNSGTRGNPGFTVHEQNGGICFGWMGRTLTVASAWR